MNHYNEYKNDLFNSLEILIKGGIILYPTDTIWGIGCDATKSSAVEKIYKLKQREDSKTMLVLMENENLLPSYVNEMHEIVWQLIDVADNPLSLILPRAKNLASNLIAEDGSTGIRITKEEFSSSLIKKFRKPIVSTSANISGFPSPACFDNISEDIKRNVDYIVKYRQDETINFRASSIIKIGKNGEIKIIRK